MYVRKADKRELTLTVSGLLWRRSLVMEDEETSSQWSHLMGRAMDGELKGTQLAVIPSEMTDWKTWKLNYPGTDVLDMSRTTKAFVTEMQKQRGVYTLGLRMGGDVSDFPFDILKRKRAISTKVGDHPVLVTYDAASATARAFDRKLKGQVLEFEMKESVLLDKASGSVWNPSTGACTRGTHKGERLAMLPGIPSFVKAWRIFYPGSETYQ
ncbi:MAG: hypothetical protein ACI9R3_001248 [Verrucomicrobiales bacterium]